MAGMLTGWAAGCNPALGSVRFRLPSLAPSDGRTSVSPKDGCPVRLRMGAHDTLAGMTSFESFDSFDDMLSAMKEAENEANSRSESWQKEVTYGDYFIRMWGGLTIYGHILTKEEFVKGESALGADKAEIDFEWSMIENSYRRGYRYGWCYSQMEPQGEPGSTHISAMDRKISKEEFEEAKKLGWPF